MGEPATVVVVVVVVRVVVVVVCMVAVVAADRSSKFLLFREFTCLEDFMFDFSVLKYLYYCYLKNSDKISEITD